MNNLDRFILYGLILAGIFVLYFKGCNDKGQEVKVVLTYDSLPRSINNSTIEKPVIFKSGEVNLPAPVIQVLNSSTLDTALLKQVYRELAEKHFAIVTQKTVSEDDSFRITTIDTLTENRILGRNLRYEILFPTSTTIISKERNKLFLGAFVEAGVKGLYNVAPSVSFENKKGLLLNINYNVYNLATNKDKFSFGVGVSQKIRLKRY